MNKKGVISFIILGLAAVIFILVTMIVANGVNNGGNGSVFEQKTKVRCQATITNPLLSFPTIKEYSCSAIGTCISLLSFGSPQFLINQDGELVLDMQGSKSSVKFSLGELTERTYNVEVCTKNTEGQLQIRDKNGALVESKLVEVN